MPLARLEKGIDLFFDERGEGEALVLVMGIGCQMIYWPEGFCDELASRGHRVVRFDHRDIGLSSKLDHLGVPPLLPTLLSGFFGQRIVAPYGLEDMADDIAELLDHLDIDAAHIVGASMGGMIAQTMAFTHPERVRSLVSMMSTTGQAGHYIHELGALRAILGKPPRSREEAVARGAEIWRTIGSKGYPYDENAARDRAGRAWDRGNHPQGFMRHLGAIAHTGDRSSRLRFVRAPTLVVHGTADPLIRPIGGVLTQRAIPSARLELIEGMGHDLPEPLWRRLADLISRTAARR